MDTLSFYLVTGDQTITSLDFGVSPRRSSADVIFRIKNSSEAYTAEDVTVSVRGDRAFTYYLSLDGEHFAATVSLGDISPGSYTTTITLRRVTPSDAPLGEEAVDVVAAPATWQNSTPNA